MGAHRGQGRGFVAGKLLPQLQTVRVCFDFDRAKTHEGEGAKQPEIERPGICHPLARIVTTRMVVARARLVARSLFLGMMMSATVVGFGLDEFRIATIPVKMCRMSAAPQEGVRQEANNKRNGEKWIHLSKYWHEQETRLQQFPKKGIARLIHAEFSIFL